MGLTHVALYLPFVIDELLFVVTAITQIMLLTDPEVESSLLISSDEGATYQKYRLNFYILSRSSTLSRRTGSWLTATIK
ncbi:hypothetical protein KUCAC02_016122, partial [Chaenocephalus aceratus]